MTVNYGNGPFAFNKTLSDLTIDIRLIPSRRWGNTLPGIIFDRLRDRFSSAELRPRYDSPYVPRPDENDDPSVVLTPWTFLVDTKNTFEVGINQNTIVATAKPGNVVSIDRLIETYFAAMAIFIEQETPIGIFRIGFATRHTIDLPFDSDMVAHIGDVFELQPRTGPRLGELSGMYSIVAEFPFPDIGIAANLELQTQDIDIEGKKLQFRLAIDCAKFQWDANPLTLDLSAIRKWIDQAFDTILTLYNATLKPAAIGLEMANG